jgi:hypothetical protein
VDGRYNKIRLIKDTENTNFYRILPVLKLQNLSKREGLTEKALDKENLETLEIDRESIF